MQVNNTLFKFTFKIFAQTVQDWINQPQLQYTSLASTQYRDTSIRELCLNLQSTDEDLTDSESVSVSSGKTGWRRCWLNAFIWRWRALWTFVISCFMMS